MTKRYLNTEELAYYLGTSVKAIYARVYRGDLPYTKLGRNLRFDINKIDELLEFNSNYHWE